LIPAVFLDSGIFIAFLNRRDRWHGEAVALFAGPPARWCTSVFVVAETYSWFLHRMGEEAARGFRQFLDQLPELTLFPGTLELHASTLQTLDRFRGAKLTYVDASSLSLLEQQAIPHVWATDRHLGFTGKELFP
jgi:predicted nucleic acid-binding protein